jgi:hypothetical protein
MPFRMPFEVIREGKAGGRFMRAVSRRRGLHVLSQIMAQRYQQSPLYRPPFEPDVEQQRVLPLLVLAWSMGWGAANACPRSCNTGAV